MARRPEASSLSGKRVLVTRAPGQADALSALLREAGAVPVTVAAIRLAPPESWAPLDAAIAALIDYDWVVFTSANGARAFADRLRQSGRMAGLPDSLQTAAVGPGTAAALAEFGLRADLVPEEYVAESLAAALAPREVTGKRVLFVRADGARDILPRQLRALGAQVDEAIAYRTLPNDEDARRLGDLLADGGLDAATFASSSAVRATVAMLGQSGAACLRELAIACIGPVTAATARELGLRVDVVPEEHTLPALARALATHFEARKGSE
ncbi:MAG: uroporphyrinogen-III synthase [Chloroflexota bacterium]